MGVLESVMPGQVDASLNVGPKAFLARWFGDETVQGINVVTGGMFGYSNPLYDIRTPLSPYFNRQRFGLGQGGWGWYPTYTIFRYSEVTGDPADDYVGTTWDGQKSIVAEVEFTWQWWDSELAMGVKNTAAGAILLTVGSTDPLSDNRYQEVIPNAQLLSRSLGEKLQKVWFEREDDEHILIAAKTALYRSEDGGASWRIVITAEAAFGSPTSQIACVTHSSLSWAIARYAPAPQTQPIYMEDDTLPVFPVGIIVQSMTAAPSADRFIVNDRYYVHKVLNVWTVTELTFLIPDDPNPPIADPLEAFWDSYHYAIFHPVEADLIVLTMGHSWYAYLIDDATGEALRAAEGTVVSDPNFGPNVQSLTGLNSETINVSVMSHAKPPITPVTVLSSAAVKVYLGEPPDGWLNTDFDTSGWDNAIIAG